MTFLKYLFTQCFIRTFHKYGFDKDLKSHFRGQGVSETKLETFTRLLMPTEDQGGGAEGCFLVLPVWTIYMRVVVSPVSFLIPLVRVNGILGPCQIHTCETFLENTE